MPRRFVFFSSLIAIIALTAACDGAKAPPAERAAPEVTVLTVKPQSVAIKTVLPGRTAPTVIAEVRPQVTGIVKSRTFSEGAEVKAGSTLYRLDPATYQTAYDSARAAVAKAEASVQTARRNVERNKELVAIKFVSQQAYDDALATLQANEADVAAAKAAAEAARINLAYTTVVAPISGRIGRSTVTAGALVTANQEEPLATIQQMNPMYVDLTQSSSEVLRLRRAMASGELKRSRDDAARVTLQLEDGSTLCARRDPAVLGCHGRFLHGGHHAARTVPESRRRPAAQHVRQGSNRGRRARGCHRRATAGGDARQQGPGHCHGGRR